MSEKHIDREKINQSSPKFRLNLINSLTGIKPANLIGTQGEAGLNLAIISSLVHLGSNPPLVGFVIRPNHDVRRDTLENVQQNRFFTINSVQTSFIEKAHYTSAKFPAHVSEFDRCALTPEFKAKFDAPYVKESQLKMGLTLQEIIPIPSNHTCLVVGEIQHVYINSEYLDDRGYIRLDLLGSSGIGGLNSYYKLEKIAEFPYARMDEVPDF